MNRERRGAAVRRLTIAVATAAAIIAPARADQPDYRADGLPVPSVATSLPGNADIGGHRRALAERGLTYTIHQRFDVLANVDGGRRRATATQGLVEATVEIDFERMAAISGLSFLGNVFLIHNSGRIRRDIVGGLNTIAAIEAEPTVRLSELWLEQRLFDGRANLRVGQLASDMEFFFSGLSGMFLQSDWATISAANLPSGAAAYPLATPGVRLRFDPTPDLSVQVALMNGDPAGPGPCDEQARNRHGLNFRLGDPPLALVEGQWRRNREAAATGLATTLKLGGWYHFGRFDDQRLGNDGRSLADPLSAGVALRRFGTWGLYGVVEHQLFRPSGGDADSGISVFGRIAVAPSDRSLIGAFVDGGMTIAGLVPGRPDDRFGISVMHARFSDGARAFDRDALRFGGTGFIRGGETNLELTYLARIVPGWTVQPVVTRVWGVAGNPAVDALVVGARSVVRF